MYLNIKPTSDFNESVQKLIVYLKLAEQHIELIELVQLYALTVLEKAFRKQYYTHYKTMSKIKFSVLIDKAQQETLISAEDRLFLIALKNRRNQQLHELHTVEEYHVYEQDVQRLLKIMQAVFCIMEEA